MSEPPLWGTSGQQDSGQYPAQGPYQHLRKGIGVTAGQLGLLQPALARAVCAENLIRVMRPGDIR